MSNSPIFMGNNYNIQFNEPKTRSIAFCLHDGSTPSVTLNGDGTVTFHEVYTLNEVAKKFWECMAYANPLRDELDRLKRENERLRSNLVTLHSIDLPVGTSLVRVEFDGIELRARQDSGSWKTVCVNRL